MAYSRKIAYQNYYDHLNSVHLMTKLTPARSRKHMCMYIRPGWTEKPSRKSRVARHPGSCIASAKSIGASQTVSLCENTVIFQAPLMILPLWRADEGWRGDRTGHPQSQPRIRAARSRLTEVNCWLDPSRTSTQPEIALHQRDESSSANLWTWSCRRRTLGLLF